MEYPSSITETDPAPDRPLESARERGPFPLTAALWCGMVVGLAQLLVILVRRLWTAGTPNAVLLGRDDPWMIVASSVVVFGTCGGLLALSARVWPRHADTVGRYGLVFLSALALLLSVPAFAAFASALLAGGLAKWIAPWTRRPIFARWMRRSLPALVVLSLGLFVCGAGRSWWEEQWALWHLPAPQRGAPNVLLVVLDTVRADHLSTYGYARNTSPHLTRLAQRGVRFEHATATAPWTLPSHASVFTGCWPHELATGRAQPLENNVLTLAEAFGARGYRTAGLVANRFFCSRTHGLHRGFAHYEDRVISASTVLSATSIGWLVVHKFGQTHAVLNRWLNPKGPFIAAPDPQRKDAARINNDALRWLSGKSDRPFFLFLNYFDAHDPYITPRGATAHFGLKPASPAEVTLLHDWPELDKSRLSPHEIRLAADSYDDCIAYLDEQLGRLFDELDRRRLLDNTVVVVTADHGEQLGEHRLFGHGISLYQPELHVPLLIVYPPAVPQGLVVREPVTLRDIPATLARIALHDDRSPFPGGSLTRTWTAADGPALAYQSASFSEVQDIGLVPEAHGKTPVADGPLEALTTDTESYIRHQRNGEEELYDRSLDPGETHNLAGDPKLQGTLQQFRHSLERFHGGSRVSRAGPSARK